MLRSWQQFHKKLGGKRDWSKLYLTFWVWCHLVISQPVLISYIQVLSGLYYLLKHWTFCNYHLMMVHHHSQSVLHKNWIYFGTFHVLFQWCVFWGKIFDTHIHTHTWFMKHATCLAYISFTLNDIISQNGPVWPCVSWENLFKGRNHRPQTKTAVKNE